MSTIKVAVVGATGRTGGSIVNALLDSADPKFEVAALTRPSSIDKPAVVELKDRGIKVVAVDLQGPEHELVTALTGIDVVIAAISPSVNGDQIPLANAALKAGVKRFVPNAWATASPPKGVMMLRDWKEDVLDHLKKIYMPYTSIDVGFWHDALIPRVPSGKLNQAALMPTTFAIDDGTVPCATIAISDVGPYVARIIADPRTLNRMVFAYGEVTNRRDSLALAERLSGETVPTLNVAGEQVSRAVAREDLDPMHRFILEYTNSAWARGDNQPDKARFQGYMDAKELYPDLKTKTLEESLREALAGGGEGIGGVGTEEFWNQIQEILEKSK